MLKSNINQTIGKLKTMKTDFIDQGYKVPQKVNRIFFEQGNHMRNAIVTLMKNTPRESYFYKATKGGKRHYPSKPGFPPAVNKGELVRSYHFEAGNMKLEVGSTSKYSGFLEDGTENMEARPVLGPVTDNYKIVIEKELEGLGLEIAKGTVHA